jgi:DNA-binding NtrC family response regulator
MRSEYLSIHATSPSPQVPFSTEGKLLNSKLANISTLVTSLNEAVEDLGMIDVPMLDDQFDFYREVEQFEINLIKSALRISGGSQVKAARLLKLNATTLNAKLKLLKIPAK